ncbi:MAG TPA: DUF6364 family protein [Oligoflexia bacterium]|nr:DUF6364 family protein [Oligoflexia bacterium]
MPRKEQITITLDSELTAKLRDIAKRQNMSLSSVIENYLKSADSLSGKSDIQRVLELVKDIHQLIEDKDAGKKS